MFLLATNQFDILPVLGGMLVMSIAAWLISRAYETSGNVAHVNRAVAAIQRTVELINFYRGRERDDVPEEYHQYYDADPVLLQFMIADLWKLHPDLVSYPHYYQSALDDALYFQGQYFAERAEQPNITRTRTKPDETGMEKVVKQGETIDLSPEQNAL